MASDQAASVQAYAAAAQTFLGLVIGVVTWRFGQVANRLLRLQTEVQIEPSVSLDLYPWLTEYDKEPQNYVRGANHSPVALKEITLSAEIFGRKADCPIERDPAVRHDQLPDMEASSEQLRCIDDFVDESLKLMKIGPAEGTVVHGVNTVFVRLHLEYRRRADGASFKQSLLTAVFKKPEIPRPMAIYTRDRRQLL